MKATHAPFTENKILLRQSDTSQQIARFSPSGLVPALQDGDLIVWDSLAIAEYLAEQFPDANLWPTDRAARALARSASAEMHSGFQNLRRQMPMNIRANFPNFTIPDESKNDIDRIQKLWTELRTQFKGKGEYLFGDYSIADMMYAPVLFRFRTYHAPLNETCQRYMEHMLQHPHLQEWCEGIQSEPAIGAYDAPIKTAA